MRKDSEKPDSEVAIKLFASYGLLAHAGYIRFQYCDPVHRIVKAPEVVRPRPFEMHGRMVTSTWTVRL